MVIPAVFEETTEAATTELKLVGNIAENIQVDIADGQLVLGKTFTDLGFLVDLDINAKIQLHLMVQKPESFLLALPPNILDVCTQAEVFIHNPMYLENYYNIIKSKGAKFGLSFKPQTAVEDCEGYVEKCDYIQFMTVDPGGQGKPFVMDVLNKISSFKDKNPNVFLQTDGGISQETLGMVVRAGADGVVIGSQIFKSPNPAETYKNFVLQFDHAHRNFLHSTRPQD